MLRGTASVAGEQYDGRQQGGPDDAVYGIQRPAAAGECVRTRRGCRKSVTYLFRL